MSQWSKRRYGEVYMEVTVVNWFWLTLFLLRPLWDCVCLSVQDLPHQGCLSLCRAMPSLLGLFGHKWFSLVIGLPKIFNIGPTYCVCVKYLPVCELSSGPVAWTSENLDWGFLSACAIDFGKGRVCSGGRLHSTSRGNGSAGEAWPSRFHRVSVSCSCSGPVPVHTSGKTGLLLCALLPLHSHIDKVLDNLF